MPRVVGHRGGDLTGRHPGQPLVAAVGFAHERHEPGDGREQWAEGEHPSEFFGHHDELRVSEADAAVRLRNGERGPVEGDERLPELRRTVRRLVAHDVVDVLAHERARALLVEHAAHRRAQVFLVGGEVELHQSVTMAARARRSSFSIGVSGRASTTTTASGNL